MLERVMLSAGSGGSGWLARYGSPYSLTTVGISVDSSKNVYIGSRWSPDINELNSEKLNSSAVVQWGRGLRPQYNEGAAFDSTIDSSGNFYICGYQKSPSYEYFNWEAGEWQFYSYNQLFVAKYNTSGTLQWKRFYSKPPTDPPDQGDEIGRRIAVDGSGNVYVAGQIWGRPGIIKLNSSGTLQWQYRLDNEGSYVCGLAATSGGTIYLVVRGTGPGGTSQGVHLVKMNTSGTVQLQRNIGWAPFSYFGAFDLAIDSSENIFVLAQNSSADRPVLIKFNSSGTIQWQKEIQSGQVAGRVCADSSGNAYTISGRYPNAIIVKFDGSGNTLWIRTIGTNLDTESGCAITADNLGSYYIAVTGSLVAKLPDTGAGTGTYSVGGVSYTYAAGTNTIANTSYTTTTPSFSWTNPSYNDGVSGAAERNWTFATQVVEI